MDTDAEPKQATRSHVGREMHAELAAFCSNVPLYQRQGMVRGASSYGVLP